MLRYLCLGLISILLHIPSSHAQETVVLEGDNHEIVVDKVTNLINTQGGNVTINNTGPDAEEILAQANEHTNRKARHLGQSIGKLDAKVDGVRILTSELGGVVDSVTRLLQFKIDHMRAKLDSVNLSADSVKFYKRQINELLARAGILKDMHASDQLTGYLSSSGKVIFHINEEEIRTDPRYQQLLMHARQEPVPFRYANRFGFQASDDRVILPPMFDLARTFEEGRALVVKNDTLGFIDTTGRMLIPLGFPKQGSIKNRIDSISDFSDGTSLVRYDRFFSKWMIVGEDGDQSVHYQSINKVGQDGLLVCAKSTFFVTDKQCLHRGTERLTPMRYDLIDRIDPVQKTVTLHKGKRSFVYQYEKGWRSKAYKEVVTSELSSGFTARKGEDKWYCLDSYWGKTVKYGFTYHGDHLSKLIGNYFYERHSDSLITLLRVGIRPEMKYQKQYLRRVSSFSRNNSLSAYKRYRKTLSQLKPVGSKVSLVHQCPDYFVTSRSERPIPISGLRDLATKLGTNEYQLYLSYRPIKSLQVIDSVNSIFPVRIDGKLALVSFSLNHLDISYLHDSLVSLHHIPKSMLDLYYITTAEGTGVVNGNLEYLIKPEHSSIELYNDKLFVIDGHILTDLDAKPIIYKRYEDYDPSHDPLITYSCHECWETMAQYSPRSITQLDEFITQYSAAPLLEDSLLALVEQEANNPEAGLGEEDDHKSNYTLFRLKKRDRPKFEMGDMPKKYGVLLPNGLELTPPVFDSIHIENDTLHLFLGRERILMNAQGVCMEGCDLYKELDKLYYREYATWGGQFNDLRVQDAHKHASSSSSSKSNYSKHFKNVVEEED